MRVIAATTVVQAVADLCVTAGRVLPAEIQRALFTAQANESPRGRESLRQLLDNAALSASLGLPLCQDCGMAVFFVEKGQDLRIEGMPLRNAINEGMIKGYRDGFLRKSTCDPFTRTNRGDNSPAVIHFDIVRGDRLSVVMVPEGASADNASRVEMLPRDATTETVKRFVLDTVAGACQCVCAPVLVGVGIGGNLETAALNAKKSLLRPLDHENPDPVLAGLERDLLESVNKLGTGPLGLGGRTTCLTVKTLSAPCHPDALPLAVYIQCHCARRSEVTL